MGCADREPTNSDNYSLQLWWAEKHLGMHNLNMDGLHRAEEHVGVPLQSAIRGTRGHSGPDRI